MKNSIKKYKGAFHANLDIITNKRIESMTILDSENYIRFLQDPKTGFYVVFDGRLNSSYYARSYSAAEKKFQYLALLREPEGLRILDRWTLMLNPKGAFEVISPVKHVTTFKSKAVAERFMLLSFYTEKDKSRN